MTISHLDSERLCRQCNKSAAFPLLIEWSTPDTVEPEGCVAETFCRPSSIESRGSAWRQLG